MIALKAFRSAQPVAAPLAYELAPEPLTEPCLMSVHELVASHAAYERRIHHDLVWGESTLTPDERAHAIAVAEQYHQWQEAVAWSHRRPDPLP